MEYHVLLFLHILSTIVWAGGAIVLGFFVVPSILDAGPAAGAVMAGVVKRRLPILISIVATVAILTGLRLYMMRFVASWVVTPQGLALTIGGILGLGAWVLGVFIQRPLAQQLGVLGASIAASGAPPTPAQAAELKALRDRMRRVARLTSWHLLGAATLMAVHRLAATFSG